MTDRQTDRHTCIKRLAEMVTDSQHPVTPVIIALHTRTSRLPVSFLFIFYKHFSCTIIHPTVQPYSDPQIEKKITVDSDSEADLRSAVTIASQQKHCAFSERNRLPALSWSWTLTAGPFSSQQVDILYWKAGLVLAGQTQRAAPKHALVLAKLLSIFLTGRLFSFVASSPPLSSPKAAHPQHPLYETATLLLSPCFLLSLRLLPLSPCSHSHWGALVKLPFREEKEHI